MLKIINVVGARPNFMKVAPIVQAMKRREREFTPLVVHTGQHYDADMSDAFFRDLDLPAPAIHLGVGSAPRDAHADVNPYRLNPEPMPGFMIRARGCVPQGRAPRERASRAPDDAGRPARVDRSAGRDGR